MECGFIDMILSRFDQKRVIASLLDMHKEEIDGGI